MNDRAIIEEHKLNDGHILQIFQDSWADSPRSWDNLGTMAIFHKRYNFGDKINFSADDFSSWTEMEEYIETELKAVVYMPIYMYDHSGITINTTGFSCPWDSGQVGFIYVTEQEMKKEFGDSYTDQDIEKAKQILLNEVKTMDEYLQGEVYGFNLVKDDTIIDSCGGFFGDNIKQNGILDHIPKELLTNNI